MLNQSFCALISSSMYRELDSLSEISIESGKARTQAGCVNDRGQTPRLQGSREGSFVGRTPS